jgi:hypothetical protein
MVIGGLVLAYSSSSPPPGLRGDRGVSSSSDSPSSCIGPLFLVAAPRVVVSICAPCNCSTSSSHFTLKLDEGRSAGSARFKQSFVRSLRDKHILWKRNKSPSVA